jgi:hypothetical protein
MQLALSTRHRQKQIFITVLIRELYQGWNNSLLLIINFLQANHGGFPHWQAVISFILSYLKLIKIGLIITIQFALSTLHRKNKYL